MTRRVSTSGAVLAAALLIVAAKAVALDASRLGLVYNTDDETSRDVARYYAAARAIPPTNVIAVSLGPPRATLAPDAVTALLRRVRERTPSAVEAYAIAWTEPYRADCMSITSALAFGFDRALCARGCAPTRESSYYGSPSRRPFVDHGLRPSMLLAGRTAANVRQLIDRGVRADATRPVSTAYLAISPDRARGTRNPRYAVAQRYFGDRYRIAVRETDGIRDVFDAMFYFIGAKRVPYLDRVGFLPGALADHLTSTGGDLVGDSQMSVLDWLEAGATASYGTVVEPCNFPQKFSDPPALMMHYLNGETAIEAYWKSVRWPGQGVFVGEPLARPFAAP